MNTTPFRQSWILFAVLFGLCAGCDSVDSVRTTMQDRISAVAPKARTVSGDKHQVFEAARRAMEKCGYQFTGGGAAQGRLDGLTRIEGGDDLRSSRQRAISIDMDDLDGGRVDVHVKIKDIVEGDFGRSAMPATETPVRDPAVYDAFFDEIEHQLKTPAAEQGRL
jgi:hypothetical protein